MPGSIPAFNLKPSHLVFTVCQSPTTSDVSLFKHGLDSRVVPAPNIWTAKVTKLKSIPTKFKPFSQKHNPPCDRLGYSNLSRISLLFFPCKCLEIIFFLYSYCKCYSSERKGFPSAKVTAQKGKISWQLGVKEYHKVTAHSEPHIRDLMGKTQEADCLCSGEKQQRTEWQEGFRVSGGGIWRLWSFPGWGLVGFQVLS